MKRLAQLRGNYEKMFHSRTLCQTAATAIKDNLFMKKRTVLPSSNTIFKVSAGDGGSCAVDIGRRTCTCLKWDEFKLPCVHACAVLHYRHTSGIDLGANDATMYCSRLYLYSTLQAAYAGIISRVDPIKVVEEENITPTSFARKKRSKESHSKQGRLRKKLREGSSVFYIPPGHY